MPDGEIQALLFDFNGTLSDDAPGLLRIYRQITSKMDLPFPETLMLAIDDSADWLRPEGGALRDRSGTGGKAVNA